VGIHITHNGDFDAMEAFGTTVSDLLSDSPCALFPTLAVSIDIYFEYGPSKSITIASSCGRSAKCALYKHAYPQCNVAQYACMVCVTQCFTTTA
jgi:hypothetical protein